MTRLLCLALTVLLLISGNKAKKESTPNPGSQSANNSETQSETQFAVAPTCGGLSSATFTNFNSGIELSKIKVNFSQDILRLCDLIYSS